MRWCCGGPGIGHRAPMFGRRRGSWFSAGWAEADVRRVEHGGVVLWAVGECLAGDEQLRDAAQRAGRGDLDRIAELGGAYLTVLQLPGGRSVVVPDAAGIHRVYTADVGGRPAWATSQSALAALIGSAVRLELLATALAAPAVTSPVLYDGIGLVRPGEAVTIDAEHADIAAVRSWLTQHDLPGTAAALRAALSAAVAGRAAFGKMLGADLSGGLDSTTLTCLAAEHAADLVTVTFADAALTGSRDLQTARAVAEQLGLRHEIVTPEVPLHFAGMNRPLPMTDTPTLAFGTIAVKQAQFAPMLAAGVTRHLTGRGADSLTVVATAALSDMWAAGHRLAALRRATDFARARNTPPLQVAAGLIGEAVAPRRARTRAVAALAAGTPAARPCGRVTVGGAAAWLTRAGRDAAAHLAATAPTKPGADDAAGCELQFMGAEVAAAAEIAHALWQLPLSAPFLDGPVLAAALALPAHRRTGPGKFKPLLKAATAGLVPAFAHARADKTSFNTSLHAGLSAHRVDLLDVLDRSRLADAGLIDAGAARSALKAAANGAGGQLGAVHTLLATECWLAAESLAENTWWTPKETR